MKKFLLTMRSKTTGGVDTVVMDVLDVTKTDEIAATVASSYGCEVVSMEPLATLRESLRECLGFVEAWMLHLQDSGNDRAAETVGDTLKRARASYQHNA